MRVHRHRVDCYNLMGVQSTRRVSILTSYFYAHCTLHACISLDLSLPLAGDALPVVDMSKDDRRPTILVQF